MATAWFVLLGFMLIVYVVLDGFDLGAGILHLGLARDDRERRTVLAAIGPVWDGNEVWLIASGGLLVFAFPRVYAVAFSGFYLPLMLVLWLIVLRGLAIELRSHHANPLWRQLFDVVFAGSSTVLALVLGVALGNVLRGVPIGSDGYFAAPLFASFTTSGELGALDWYTLSVGAFAVVVLAAHGAMFLRWKTAGELAARATRLARRLWIAVAICAVAVTIETAIVRPELVDALVGRPGLWILPVLAASAIVVALVALARGWELRGFLASALAIASLLGLSAGAIYPVILRSTLDPGYSLYVATSANEAHGLAIGLAWWIPAVSLAIGYFAYLFRSIRGKAEAGEHE
ncbi:MAG TPA: cytochrome d ubiquinol oxidase subunit II [Kofleriaceae bacterium]|nr:cytochrome d ubiquinol oxidase subunit II [Kofleriaceae bacterium]